MKIIIYSVVDVFYYSFYIEGLYNIYGRKNVSFGAREFPKFTSRTLAAIIKNNGKETKIVIDALDSPGISVKELKWCNIYGKVNYNKLTLPNTLSEKIKILGPSFGIRIWSIPETIFFSLSNYYKSKDRIYLKKYFFTSYWRQYKRLPYKKYLKAYKSKNNYIYFISSLWKNEPETNELRSKFIKACKEIEEIEFEGGFAPRSDKNELIYSDLIDKRIPPSQYLKRIKKSFVVFNTPAVQQCHGWKLAEFLALGKAIITTSYTNELPEPLKHGIHVHYVNPTEEEIKEVIRKIFNDEVYRNRMEKNSKEYFNQYLTPKKSIQRLLSHFN
ncbi:glycosyltransferase [Salegentibacter sp. F14]